MAKRMMGVWLAGFGLVAFGLAQAQAQAAAPTEAQIKAARKKVRSAAGVLGSMTRKLIQDDKELSALKAKRDEAAKKLSAALRQIMSKTPEAAPLAEQEAAVVQGLEDTKKQMAELRKKQADLRTQQRDLQKKLRTHRAKAMRDPSIAATRKAAAETGKALSTAARAKLVVTSAGKKAVEQMEAASKAYRELVPRKKAAPRKRAPRKGAKRGKAKPTK